MNLETITHKQLNDLEVGVKELLTVMRKAKLQQGSLVDDLKELEQILGEVRRERFDAVNSQYDSY